MPSWKSRRAALVIDHWKPRGIAVTHDDYAAASVKGGNELNMASDTLTAAEWLRGKGYEKVGSIGESQGSSALLERPLVLHARRVGQGLGMKDSAIVFYKRAL